MNDRPQDYHTLYPWFGIIRSLRSVGRSGGLSVVTLQVVVDEHGKPLLWGNPSAVRLNPRQEAREIINDLLANLTVKEP